MTGFFNSRSGAGARNYYYYVPSDKKLHDIGLSSYTRNSLEKFGKRITNGQEDDDPDISEYLSGGIDSIKPILKGDNATLMLYRFDKPTKRYLYTTNSGSDEDNIFWTPSGGSNGTSAGNAFSSLSSFQSAFDLYQKGFIDNATSGYNIKYVWAKINNSLSGCINFNVRGYSILNSPSSGVVSLFFQSKSDGSNRGVAFQPPVIAGVRKTATGQEHSNISDSLEPGVFAQPDVGGSRNPNNTVAGELNLHYNRGTGKWESGTIQIYCQVLDDIPGVPQKDLVANPDTVSNESLSIPFQSGWGMVLTQEKGNPHLCVPCSFGCGPSPKEKIPLSNRSPRAFVRGEIILASQIGPDWVPIPLSNGLSVAKKLTFEWSQIQKYVANARSFFRAVNDTRFLDRDIYADNIRSRFYDSLNSSTIISNTDLARLRQINLAKITNDQYNLTANGQVDLSGISFTPTNLGYYPANGYLQFYDADLLPVELGGNNTKPSGYLINTIVSRTEPYDPDTGVAAQDVPFSWGMYFPDGYSSLGVKKTISSSSVTSAPDNSVYNSTTLNFSPYITLVTAGAGRVFNLRDSYFYHLPAQMALNNNTNNQSININLLHNIVKLGASSGPFCDQLIRYIRDPNKGYYLMAGSRPAYGLSPINTAKVQFTPLSLETALSHTFIANEGVGAIVFPTNGGYGDAGLKKQLASVGLLRTQRGLGNSGFFGNGIVRNGLSQYILEVDSSVSGPISFGKNLLLAPQENPIFGPPQRGDRPDGGPGILPTNGESESSNVVGIIAAKATFTLSQGGTIELKTDQRLGIFAYLANTVGSSSTIANIIGSIVSLISDNSGKSTQNRVVQWGGSLGAEQYKELGTTALWCAVYDHAPQSIYDGRYFTPIQFNPSGNSVDFIEVSGSIGRVVTGDTEIKTVTNQVRRNMLLTDPDGRGGFSYTKKIIGANPNGWVIVGGGSGYRDNDVVEFSLGTRNAKFIVSRLNEDTSIGAIKLHEEEYGGEAYGETANDGSANPFKTPLQATFPGSNNSATIELRSGKVIERLMTDKIKFYGIKKLTKEDNNGLGDGRGQIEGIKTTTFQLEKNSTGKYDIFFFFVSDIANYPEGGAAGGEGGAFVPQARYVNLEITSI